MLKERIKQILKRLKKPSVIVSLISEVATLLILFNCEQAANLFTGIATAVLSVLVLLGVVSNPDSKKYGFGDDMYVCNNCNKCTLHVEVGGKLLCKECGNETTVPIKCIKNKK